MCPASQTEKGIKGSNVRTERLRREEHKLAIAQWRSERERKQRIRQVPHAEREGMIEAFRELFEG